MKAQGISDYGLIGDTRGAALSGRNGSIDWCCLPEFDSAAVFGLLLGDNGGFFAISPSEEFESEQQYEPDTNVVITTFEVTTGTAKLSDAFCVMTEEEKKERLFPDHEILRIVEGTSGSVSFKLEFEPRLFYGNVKPKITNRGKLGVHFGWKEHIFIFNSTLEPDQIVVSEQGARVTATFDVIAGSRFLFSFSYSSQSPAIIPEIKITGADRMRRTISYWRDWINRCSYRGRYIAAVRRSALALKLLSHAPSGAIIAAPTTSLPEYPGGERNWDYRYCWLRDASFTSRALIRLGYYEEMEAYLNWILHATRLTRPRLQVVYSVYGKARLKETTAPWLSGYRQSRPVRLGNKAHDQFQLDVYGEVLDAICAYATVTKRIDKSMQHFALGLGKVICELWNQPDNGIWEIRSANKHHTHSKVMAWVGLDCLIKLARQFGWKNAPVKQFAEVQALLRGQIEREGYNEELKCYTREFGGTDVDACLLVLPLMGYTDAGSPRMTATTDLICATLSKNDLVYRYKNVDDGVPGAEGAFALCSFWLSENLTKRGEVERGVKVFETLLQHSSKTGLLSEEVDPDTGEMLGNYPQAFTHIGLINAAITIEEAEKRKFQ